MPLVRSWMTGALAAGPGRHRLSGTSRSTPSYREWRELKVVTNSEKLSLTLRNSDLLERDSLTLTPEVETNQ